MKRNPGCVIRGSENNKKQQFQWLETIKKTDSDVFQQGFGAAPQSHWLIQPLNSNPEDSVPRREARGTIYRVFAITRPGVKPTTDLWVETLSLHIAIFFNDGKSKVMTCDCVFNRLWKNIFNVPNFINIYYISMNRIYYFHSSGQQHLFKITANNNYYYNISIIQFHLRPHLIHKHLQVVLGIKNDGDTIF